VAIILGSVTLKLSGHFLPLGTMAWGISLYFLFGNMEFLGGHGGLSGIPPISLFGSSCSTTGSTTTSSGPSCWRPVHHPQPARLPRGAGDPRAQGRHGDGRGDGRGYVPRAHGDLRDRRAARLRGGLAAPTCSAS
jgi:hypothetical protein